jgi:hypothetical protein
MMKTMKRHGLLIGALIVFSLFQEHPLKADILTWNYLCEPSDSGSKLTIQTSNSGGPASMTGSMLYGCISRGGTPCFIVDGLEWQTAGQSMTCAYQDPDTGQCMYYRYTVTACTYLSIPCGDLDFDLLCIDTECWAGVEGCNTFFCNCGELVNPHRVPGQGEKICEYGIGDGDEYDLEPIPDGENIEPVPDGEGIEVEQTPNEKDIEQVPDGEEADTFSSGAVIPYGGASCSISYRSANLAIVGGFAIVFLLSMILARFLRSRGKMP